MFNLPSLSFPFMVISFIVISYFIYLVHPFPTNLQSKSSPEWKQQQLQQEGKIQRAIFEDVLPEGLSRKAIICRKTGRQGQYSNKQRNERRMDRLLPTFCVLICS